MEPTWAEFKIWGQHGISELAEVNLRRGSNSGLNIYKANGYFEEINRNKYLTLVPTN